MEPRSGGSSQDEVCETKVDRVLTSVYQGAVGQTLHLGPESVKQVPIVDIIINNNLHIYPLRHDNAVQETRQPGTLLLHELNKFPSAKH